MNTNSIELLNPYRNWKIGTFGHLKLLEVAGNIDFRDPYTLNSVAIIRGTEPNILIIDPNDLSINQPNYDLSYLAYDGSFVDFSDGIVEIKGNLDIRNKLHVENINYINTRPIHDTCNNHLTLSTDIQDLSNLIFDYLTPRRYNSRIMIHIKVNYYCSVAYSERITIELWRNDILISKDINLGTINATGGFKNTYTLSFMDLPNNLYKNKYYIKYKLENNDSLVPQGIIDITNSSSIILYELS